MKTESVIVMEGCYSSDQLEHPQHENGIVSQLDSNVGGISSPRCQVMLGSACDVLEGRTNTIGILLQSNCTAFNQLQYRSPTNITSQFVMYELPAYQPDLPSGPSQLESVEKIMKFFYNKLPSNFAIGGHLLYGECLMQHSSNLVPKALINPKRKRCRFVSNNDQLLLMNIQPESGIFGFTRKIGKANWVRILYTHVLAVKLSTYSSAIMVVYVKGGIEQLSNDHIERQAIIIEPTEIGATRGDQIRYHILKCVSKNAGSQINKLNEHCDKTLLDYEMYKEITKGNMKSKYIVQENNTVTEAEISRIKVVNLKKMVEDMNKSNNEDKNIEEASQIRSANDVMKIYRVFKKEATSMESECYKMYVAERKQTGLTNKSRKLDSSDLVSLKIISKSLLSELPGLLYQIYNECRAYQQYQLITPYVPVLTNCFSNTKTDDFPYLIMEYKYFELHCLAELIKKDKITLSRKEPLKLFLAELITAIGHVHECGYICGSHMFKLHKVGLNWDGHASLCHLDGFINLKHHNPELNKRELIVEGIRLQNFQIQTINKAPQQLQQSYEESFAQDWWYLGMLLHEFITGSHVFENCKLEAEKMLNDSKCELSLPLLQKYQEENPELIHLVRSLLIKDPLRRLGWKNDYHTVLDVQYFKGIDKKKLMKRQGESIINTRTKLPKPDKQIKDLDLWPNDLKRSPKNYNGLSSADVNKVLKACEFQRDFEIE